MPLCQLQLQLPHLPLLVPGGSQFWGKKIKASLPHRYDPLLLSQFFQQWEKSYVRILGMNTKACHHLLRKLFYQGFHQQKLLLRMAGGTMHHIWQQLKIYTISNMDMGINIVHVLPHKITNIIYLSNRK